jgi:hypothetical protein
MALLAAGVAVLVASHAGGQAPAVAPQPGTAVNPSHEQALGEVPWVELVYSAHKFFLGASTTIRAERAPVAALASAVKRPLAGTPVPLPETDIVTITTKTDLPFGRDETVTVWIDPAASAALGGEKTMLGHGAYHKFLRYTEEGLYTWRSSPANVHENTLGFESWSDLRRYLVAPAVRPAQGTPVTDSYALLYLVSAARLDRKGSGLKVVMLADDRFVEVTFIASKLTYSRASFEEVWPGGRRQRDGHVLVRTVRATARALGANEASEDVELGFLGMRGALTLYLEAGTGLPVALSGRVQHIGEVTVRLERAVLKRGPEADASP